MELLGLGLGLGTGAGALVLTVLATCGLLLGTIVPGDRAAEQQVHLEARVSELSRQVGVLTGKVSQLSAVQRDLSDVRLLLLATREAQSEGDEALAGRFAAHMAMRSSLELEHGPPAMPLPLPPTGPLPRAATVKTPLGAAAASGPRPIPLTEHGGDAFVEPLFKSEVVVHGVRVKFLVRELEHVAMIGGHVSRELNGYALLKDAVAAAARRGERPLVLDVGGNHGIYALFAAALGADVVVVEPQLALCKVIHAAAERNGPAVAGRLTVYHAAVLGDVMESVALDRTEVGEGGVATVVRGGGGGGERAVAYPPTAFLPAAARLCFLKVDVEGFELAALGGSTLAALVDAGRIANILVEFGPPGRWARAGATAGDGLQLLKALQGRGLVPRLLKSQVWDDFWPANIVDADGYSVRRPVGQAEVDALQNLRAFEASWQPLPGDGGGATNGGGGSWASWLFGAAPPPPPAAALDSVGPCPVDRCVGLELDALKQRLIESMPKYGDGGCCEAYVWFAAEPDLEAPTFLSSCADAPEPRLSADGQDWLYGCD
jgi:FkbM family methyltransferase